MGNRCADVATARAGGLVVSDHAVRHGQRAEAVPDEAHSDSSDDDLEDQDHVFAFADELGGEETAALDEQFRSVLEDRAWWARAFVDAKINHEEGQGKDWEPPQQLLWTRKKPPKLPTGASYAIVPETAVQVTNTWEALGYDTLGRGRLAVVVLAGKDDGGLRKVPIGMADIGLLSKKPPFQILCERLLRLQSLVDARNAALKQSMKAGEGMSNVERKRIMKLYGAEKMRSLEHHSQIPLFIMTNMSHFLQVRGFFEAHDWFGLTRAQVVIFPQPETPIFDPKGKVKLAAKNRMMTCPGGSGELFRAMQEQGVLADLKANDIDFVWVGSIDNLLSKVGDPQFLGFCRASGAGAAIKVVQKMNVDEELGILLQAYQAHSERKVEGVEHGIGEARLVEYSNLSWEVKNMRSGLMGDTGLKYRLASTCEFVFPRETVEEVCRRNAMRRHWVPLSLPYLDWRRGGIRRSPLPSQKNSISLQTFVGDCLEFVPRAAGYLIPRWSDFAPMKAEGRSSVMSAVWTLSTTHQRWILQAGCDGFAGFWDNSLADESQERLCEVSPLVSYAGEGLGGAFVQGTKLDLPLHLEARREAVNGISPRLLENFDAEAEMLSLAQREPSPRYVADESPVGALEMQLQQEAQQRASAAAVGGGRPLTGGAFAEGEDSERLPVTPRGADDAIAKAAVQAERARHMEKDEQTALADWQASQAFQDALSRVTRFPQLDRLDEARLKAKMTKASSAGDSMSEAFHSPPGSRMGSKVPASRMGSKAPASPASRSASKTAPEPELVEHHMNSLDSQDLA